MRGILRNKNGMTLIELMIVLFVTVILLGGVAIIVGSTTRFFREEDSNITMQINVRQLSVQVEKDVRRSSQDASKLIQGSGIKLDDGEPSAITYTIADNKVYRNGVLVASNIQEFTSSINGGVLTLVIKAVPDVRGQVESVETIINLRKGD